MLKRICRECRKEWYCEGCSFERSCACIDCLEEYLLSQKPPRTSRRDLIGTTCFPNKTKKVWRIA